MRKWLLLTALGAVLVGFARAQDVGAVAGTVEDAETGEAVGFAQVLLEESGRSGTADHTGRFEILFVQPDAYTLKVYRIGYEPLIRAVQVSPGDTLRLRLRMSASPIEQGEVVVEGAADEARQLADAAMEIEGRKLRQNLGTTIAETLDDEPGIAMRSMGPAPARPVLRGLGGERLLVLEDGGRTGDLSATSTDHAVVIDPLTSERIEVIRGPAALVYGPNTLGGVVNVVRGYVPSTRPGRLHAGAGVQAQSVNDGFSGGFDVEVPAGPLVVRADGSVRNAGDVSTPVGSLENTDLTTYNTSAGASVVGSWGHAGLAGSLYTSEYGIPGGFVGAHPHGVDIELSRSHIEGRAELFRPVPWVPRAELQGSFSRYHHREYEAEDVLGIEFGLLSYHGKVLVHTHRNGHLRKGAVGLWSEYRDFASGGFSFTPDSKEWTVAGFGYQDIHFERFTLQGGLRYDFRRVNPVEGEDEESLDRTFGGISASLRGMLHVTDRTSFGASVMRSLRLPGLEELYSEGPHLAAYSFEVGNPDLNEERGWGSEIFVHVDRARAAGALTLFYNVIDGYIFPRNTGQTNVRTLLPIYQQTGARARMLGGEISLEARPAESIRILGTASYVHGALTETDEPLPWMPPLSGKIDASYTLDRWTVGATMRGVREQDRLGPFEEPTEGYTTAGAYLQYHVTTGSVLHSVDLVIDNLTHAEYRDHLSRVKSVMPEPGRNVKLLYKVYL